MQKIKIVALISIAVILMILDYKFNIFVYIKSGVNTIITPIYKIIDLPSSVYDYINQPKKTQTITQELLELRAKANKYNLLLLENQKLSEILGASYVIADNNFILARITNIKQSRLRKTAVIDKGMSDNIAIGDVVLSSNGVIGRIESTSYYYSTIKLISDPLSYIPVINTRSGERAIAKGVANNSNTLVIQNIALNSDVQIGDVFATSGIVGVFSNGFDVGKVIDIKQNHNLIEVVLEPLQDIKKTLFVLVDR